MMVFIKIVSIKMGYAMGFFMCIATFKNYF